MVSGVIAPDGTYQATVIPAADLTLTTIERDTPAYDIPLTKARPWRTTALKAAIYEARRPTTDRSTNHTCT